MCSSVPFIPGSLVTAVYPGKFYPLFSPQGSTIPEDAKIVSGILNVHSKTEVSSLLGKRKCSTKTTEKSCKIIGNEVAFLESEQKNIKKIANRFKYSKPCFHELFDALFNLEETPKLPLQGFGGKQTFGKLAVRTRRR